MQASKAADVKSEINVTPLVDVVLVLLIIFMVVTPMLQKGQAVRLPVTDSPEKKPDDKNQVLVAISSTKDYYIDKDRMTEAQFAVQIKETFERSGAATSVVVKADKRLTYGDVKKAMMKVKDAGFTNVGLITEKRSKKD